MNKEHNINIIMLEIIRDLIVCKRIIIRILIMFRHVTITVVKSDPLKVTQKKKVK